MLGGTHIEIKGLPGLVNALRNMARTSTAEMMNSMEDSAMEASEIMRSNIPTRTGSLANAVSYDVRNEGSKVTAYVGPDDGNFGGRSVGRAVELGLGSGQAFPPAQEIADRYGLSLGVGFLVARAIHEKGSGGVFYGQKTYDMVQGVFAQRGIATLYSIASKF